ncbi:DNA mismatch repair protein MutS [Ruminiclostridium herbifermentans]|uniref:DNA mismatch repair protein MutS n=1 Tax=Ruminiclostridium herbifermentans TaxID=2488810 RepID=A0A4U7JCY2_9FIRM|nr:MutS family DNA mismatch repair protein [Ruminiclostridium herbifermentans]QNU67746.1 DNA mismatch repair protein MutS [Ruminiclostridium herbifermentans]
MTTPEKKYQKRVEAYSAKLDLYTKKSSTFGNYKLLVFFIGIGLAVVLYIFNQLIFMSAQIILFLSAFIYLSIVQNHIIKRKNYSYAMYQINKMCLKRINGEWSKFSDVGEEFENQEHNYTYDLDIFGRNSLFQMINMTSTYSGRHKLAEIFLNPLEKKEDILERQEAISELSRKLMFRQRMLSNAIISNKNLALIDDEEINSGYHSSSAYSSKKKRKTLLDTMNKLEEIYLWAKQENKLYSSNGFILLITGLPVLTLILLVLSIFGVVSPYLPILGFSIQFLMLAYKANFRSKNFEIVEKYANTLKVYSGIIKQFESEKFESDYINELKKELKGKSQDPAWKQIEKLSKLWELIANRYNLFHAIVNVATLWDYHCLVRLEKWKIRSGKYVQKWFDIIGEVEALSSMSILRHDNPEFIMPQITEDLKAGITAEQLGHPLLGKDRKCNDISFDSNQPILLITGSNMSGKSTFLRTVGISLLLATLGMPVCAKFFKCPILKIYACMRTSDNLGQNVSSFYAELLRVKMIVEAVDRNERVFFLLDEIFKGTNSADRHMGAKMLIRQLDKKATWGMVSTHDLELADLEKESNSHIRNYHFKEYYKDNKIYFDYRLRKGVSDTRNAIYLMRMAGVSVED